MSAPGSYYSTARRALRDARKCREANNWPGYYWFLSIARSCRDEARDERRARYLSTLNADVLAGTGQLMAMLEGQDV